MRPKPHSRLLNKFVRLELSQEAADLGVILTPNSPRILDENGDCWILDCTNSSKNGNFVVKLKVEEWDFTSMDLPMSLGHNKVEIAETSGPTQSEWGYWTYAIKVISSFTKEPAGGVPVTVVYSEGKPQTARTDYNGWLFLRYNDGLSVKVTIFNPYDGSNA